MKFWDMVGEMRYGFLISSQVVQERCPKEFLNFVQKRSSFTNDTIVSSSFSTPSSVELVEVVNAYKELVVSFYQKTKIDISLFIHSSKENETYKFKRLRDLGEGFDPDTYEKINDQYGYTFVSYDEHLIEKRCDIPSEPFIYVNYD